MSKQNRPLNHLYGWFKGLFALPLLPPAIGVGIHGCVPLSTMQRRGRNGAGQAKRSPLNSDFNL
ncbi:hypothetical protein [Paenibacillus peoriae]|uniref:hypothetical protein n=1 Tax=Paenibacillus peoriae TaxID=59893 RepID=UPI00215AD934|nr:hypothetical protein [Paenibacillus peoriae]